MTNTLAQNLTGPRQETWAWFMFDVNGAPLGQLDGVESATFTFNVNATIRTAGSLVWSAQDLSTMPDWPTVRLQPIYTATFPDGTSTSWSLGMFIAAAPTADWTDFGQSRQIQLFDRLLTLDGNHFPEVYTAPAGSNVTTLVKALLVDAGQTAYAVTDTSETLTSAMNWQADTSHLAIINALLGSINYFSLYADGNGVFRADPYVDPQSRPTVWSFLDDSNSVYAPDFSHTIDVFDAPNRIICVSASDGTTTALTSVQTNTNPASRISTVARGYVLSRTDSGVEATSQASLDAICSRRLSLATSLSAVVQLNHLPLQAVTLNSVVRFRRQPAGLDFFGVVQSMTINTAVGSLVQTQILQLTATS